MKTFGRPWRIEYGKYWKSSFREEGTFVVDSFEECDWFCIKDINNKIVMTREKKDDRDEKVLGVTSHDLFVHLVECVNN